MELPWNRKGSKPEPTRHLYLTDGEFSDLLRLGTLPPFRSVGAGNAAVNLVASGIGGMHIKARGTDGRERQSEVADRLNHRPDGMAISTLFWRRLVEQLMWEGRTVVWSPRRTRSQVLMHATSATKRIGSGSWDLVVNGQNVVARGTDVVEVFDTLYPELGMLKGAPCQYLQILAAMVRYEDMIYSKGLLQQIAIISTRPIDPKERESLKEDFNRDYQGGVQKAFKPIVVSGGDIQIVPLNTSEFANSLPVQIRAAEAQLLESCGIPEALVHTVNVDSSTGKTSTSASMPSMRHLLLVNRVRPLAEIMLGTIATLWSPLRLEFDDSHFARGDPTQRAEMHRMALGEPGKPAWMTPNEVRQLEGLDPLPGGDELNLGNQRPTEDSNANTQEEQ